MRTPDRWERIQDLYHAARARNAGERGGFLDQACADDAPLRREVQALLDQPIATADFLGVVGGALADRPAASWSGKRLGPYHIRELIGRGGMGEVYRAHDTNLGRDVAIKVLPDAFAKDPARLARFDREARAVASLNDPHIAAIHGVEESEGIRGLVLELVEGDTLADRLARSAASARPGLPVREALEYARQVASALEAAHEKGITHRDLKPANVKITSDGAVKLLDFGIAKVVAGEPSGNDLSHGSNAATVEGVMIGTPGYMSPEQARGKPVDKRSDIWAFGCVLYEMLSGRMAFQGETTSDTIAAVLEREPDWATLPATTPASVRTMLRRCLEKDPKQRLRDIGDARIELDQLVRGPIDTRASTQDAGATSPRRALAPLVLAVLGLAVALGVTLMRRNTAVGDTRVSRFTVALGKDQVIVPSFVRNVALSRDGSMLAFTPLPGPVVIRRLDSLESRPVDATTEPNFRGAPLFSPNGASIAFIEGNAIFSATRPFYKASLSGGAPLKLADYDMFHEGDWAQDGWIYWTANYPGGIVRIRDSGGPIEQVTKLDIERGERSHRFARLLPDGGALLYTVAFDGIDSYDNARIDVWDLKTQTSKTLISGGTSAAYLPSGHILYASSGKLFAVPFDASRREVTGAPFEVLNGVMMSRNTGAAHFSVSDRGDLAYVPGAAEGGRRTLVWVDREGKQEPLPLAPASYLYPRISPDGQNLAVEIEGPNHDFYLYDFARTVLSKVTTDGMSHDPVWSPDGRLLAFRSWQVGGMTMWAMPADRSSGPRRLDSKGTRQSPVSFSPDGQYLAFDQKDARTNDDVWVLPMANTEAPRAVAQSRFNEGSAKFSPDGKWIAYSSDESGRPEIYVQAFPGPGLKLQVSSEGGFDPVWRPSGGELYYRSRNRMMVVSVTTSPQFRASAPRQLWQGTYMSGLGSSCGMPGVTSASYAVTPDGSRFLMVKDEDVSPGTQIVVVLNFAKEVRAKERAARSPAS